jgi:hypothetical protein
MRSIVFLIASTGFITGKETKGFSESIFTVYLLDPANDVNEYFILTGGKIGG